MVSNLQFRYVQYLEGIYFDAPRPLNALVNGPILTLHEQERTIINLFCSYSIYPNRVGAHTNIDVAKVFDSHSEEAKAIQYDSNILLSRISCDICVQTDYCLWFGICFVGAVSLYIYMF